VDTEDIKKRVQPIMKPGIITVLSHFFGSLSWRTRRQSSGHMRIEFDCQAILYVEFRHNSNEINQKLLRGVQGGGFLEKSPPGRRRQ